MFKLVPCAKNTYYLKSFANVGVYDLGNGLAVLIDSGDHKKSVHDLDKELERLGLRVKTIINTHSHIDHITGNKFFKQKYGCEIFSSSIEHALASEPNIEGTFYFSAVPIRRLPDGRLSDKGVEVKLLKKEDLPDGFETAQLPGHNFNMIGVKTPDDVWFLGDSVLAKETFDFYKIPFFLDINKSIETARKVKNLKGKLFVPAHAEPCEDISELADFNAEKLCEMKEYFFDICGGRSLEQIIEKADDDLCLKFNPDKYAKVSLVVKGFLQALMDDGRITAEIEKSRLVYSHL